MSDQEKRIISVEEAGHHLKQELRKLNARVPQQMLPSLDDLPPIKIFNVCREAFTVNKGSIGTFFIPSCPEGAICSPALEIPRIFREIQAEVWDLYEGIDVAKDIIGIARLSSPANNLAKWGVFIAKGQEPSDAELDEARAQLFSTCFALVQQANELAKAPSDMARMININHMHLNALKYIQTHKPPWA